MKLKGVVVLILIVVIVSVVLAQIIWHAHEDMGFNNEFGFSRHIQERVMAHDFVEYRLSRLCVLQELTKRNENDYLEVPDLKDLKPKEVDRAMAEYDLARDIAKSQHLLARKRYLNAEELAFGAGFLAPKDLPCATPERQ